MDAFNTNISSMMSRLLASNTQLKILTGSCVKGRNTTHVVGVQYVGTEKSVDPTKLLSMMLQTLTWLEYNESNVAVAERDVPKQHPDMNAAVFTRQQALQIGMMNKEQLERAKHIAVVLVSRIGNQGRQANAVVCC